MGERECDEEADGHEVGDLDFEGDGVVEGDPLMLLLPEPLLVDEDVPVGKAPVGEFVRVDKGGEGVVVVVMVGGCVAGEVGEVVGVGGITVPLPPQRERLGEGVVEEDWEGETLGAGLRLPDTLPFGDPDRVGVGEAVLLGVLVKLPPKGDTEGV